MATVPAKRDCLPPLSNRDSRADNRCRIARTITRRDFLNGAVLASGGLLTAASPADVLRNLATTKTFRLEEATIADVQAAYKSGATTATQLVQAYLERIQGYDQKGPKLNVVIFLNPKATQQRDGYSETSRSGGDHPCEGQPA